MIKLINKEIYRGALPFYLSNLDDKIIYLTSNNKNINDYYHSLKYLNTHKILKIESYDYNKEELFGINVKLLELLKSDEKFIILLSVDALFYDYYDKLETFELNIGKEYKQSEIVEYLIESGFTKNYMVEKIGEFSQRGDIIDLFPAENENPIRLDFFADQLEEIREFDIDSQKSIKNLKNVYIYKNKNKSKIDLNSILSGFMDELTILLENDEIINYKIEEKLISNINMYIDKNKYFNFRDNAEMIEVISFNSEMETNYKDLEEVKKLSSKYKISIFTEEVKRYKEIFENYDINIEEFLHYEGYLYEKNLVLTDRELKGIKVKQIEKRKNALKLKNINQINNGDYVIHENYGLGQFLGIEIIDGKDYIAIKYADEDKLFVPIDGINRIEKYICEPGIVPEIYKLGRKGFKRKRDKLKKEIIKFAKELIELQAKRESKEGFVFSADTVWQEEFEEGFPFNETPDQLKAINDVKKDMESLRVMDRIVCGDVGFGKTEVALRAAFKACMDGKQVCLMAPTTVLADQHFERFKERFKNFPIEMGLLSRLKTAKEQKELIKKAESGLVDLVIGTHRLLSEDVKFSNLGLLIIDEEQKFGVKAKEKIKKLRYNVDILTLTATPIPRTLNLALLGIRDLSIIETAPTNRIPVETMMINKTKENIKKIILHEIAREGQVFYLFNSVKKMENKLKELKSIIPNFVSIEHIHGQMSPSKIQKKIHEFSKGNFDILLTTTIIENGIDIENANTILIEGMEKLGLAQIYQLRGRVGRSGKKAYCYLLKDEDRKLVKKTEQRKDSLIINQNLNAGFQLSLEDMRIRGAGEILGNKQHGAIESFGYDLYMKMLQEEIKRIKNIHIDDEELFIDIDNNGFIPNDYIIDDEKIVVYKRILLCNSLDELKKLKDEITDRFGKMPIEVKNLFDYNNIKIKAKKLHIKSIKKQFGKYHIEINQDKFDVEKLFDALSKQLFIVKDGIIITESLNEFLEYFEVENE